MTSGTICVYRSVYVKCCVISFFVVFITHHASKCSVQPLEGVVTKETKRLCQIVQRQSKGLQNLLP